MNNILRYIMLLLTTFLYVKTALSQNSKIIEWTQKYSGFSKNESFSLEDSSKILHYKNEGTWEDSMGNFGTQICFGLVLLKKSNDIISMELYCEARDQDDHKYITRVTRNSSLEAGVGEYTLIDGNGKWQKVINSKCRYGIKYKEAALFVNSKCKSR